MAVPLAEIRIVLAVAMIDANNVQAVDYPSWQDSTSFKGIHGVEMSVRHVINIRPTYHR